MIVHAIYQNDGSNNRIVGVSIALELSPAYSPLPYEDIAGSGLFLDVGDLPVSYEVLCENFDKFEVVGTNVQLISGETVSAEGRYLPFVNRDNTNPLALNRANKTTIFQNL